MSHQHGQSAIAPPITQGLPADAPSESKTLTVVVFFLVALILTFSLSIGRNLDIDEHGFIASGALMARHGLLPYRDYHYNHMPTEVMIYAALFRMTDHLLLAARAFQALCAAGTATAVFAAAYGAAPSVESGERLKFAWAIGALLLTNQLFTHTAGISWNHDFPLLTALLGFLTLRAALAGPHAAVLTSLAGFLIGLSATSRLTYLPIVAPLGLFVLLYPGLTVRKRLLLAALFTAGFALAALPSAWVWSKAWRNAFFGNFLYPHLNTQIHNFQDVKQRSTFFAIVLYYVKMSLVWPTGPTVFVLTVAFIVLVARRLRGADLKDRRTWELLAIMGTVVILAASGFLPAPPYPQYVYGPIPFMVLGIALALASMPIGQVGRRVWTWTCLFCIGCGAWMYWHVVLLPFPHKWVPMRVHAAGVELARELPHGLVLTIEPLFPLEGGMEIDPRFAVGRFAPRVADLLSAGERRQYLMPGLGEMASVFDEDSPGSVLVMAGSDPRVQNSMISEAVKRGYQPAKLSFGWGTINPVGKVWVKNR